MKILSKLFGSKEVIDAGISGIDKAFYTKEEQADNELKKINYKMAFMKLYEPFKVAQRFLALLTGIPFIVAHVLILIVWLASVFLFAHNSEMYDFTVTELFRIAEMNNDTLGLPFLVIISFYFGGGMLEGAITKYIGVRSAKK